MADKGFFIISDISGYTAFLTHAELEHAEDILRHLISAMLDRTLPPLSIAKLEGDAIFSYSPEGSFLQGQSLLETVENMYCVFRETMERTRLNTTCTCTACTLIPTLDLKFVAHYGEYVVQNIGQMRDLQGKEVITVHRLLKNAIKEATGFEAYAFFSEAAVKAAGMEGIVEAMTPHREEYEHVGVVPGHVHDLHPVWERWREQKRDVVAASDAWISLGVDLPVPPPLAWDYVTRPDLKAKWMGVKGMSIFKPQKGRQAIGSEQHCAHDDASVTIFQITDWRPFEHYSIRYEPTPGVAMRETIYLTPTETGTRVERAATKPIGSSLAGRLKALVIELFMAKIFKDAAAMIRLRNLVEADLAEGKAIIVAADPEGIAKSYAAEHPFKRLTPIVS